jgi:hypothetical protein
MFFPQNAISLFEVFVEKWLHVRRDAVSLIYVGVDTERNYECYWKNINWYKN